VTNKNKETKRHIHPKHKTEREKTALTEQTTPGFGTPFTTSSQENKWAPFLQPRSPHGDSFDKNIVIILYKKFANYNVNLSSNINKHFY